MKQWLKYLVFENAEDFFQNTVYHTPYRRRVNGGAIETPNQYPVCFKYKEGYKPGFMGNWIPCSIDDAIMEWLTEIQSKLDFVDKCREIFKMP